MAICGHLAPNGKKSILYDELYQKYGESKAHDIWEQIRSQQFLNKYGDWTELKITRAKALNKAEEAWRANTDKKGFPKEALQPLLDAVNKKYDETKVPLDVNGEPTTEWVEKTLNIKPLNKQEKYTQERIKNAISKLKGNNEFLSNFYQLKVPIKDEFGNEYWNSEGYYMALRTNDQAIKHKISELSAEGGNKARSARKTFMLEMDESKRAEYMDKVIKAKFDLYPELKQMLFNTGTKEIIEGNAWKDDLFGVRLDTMQGANILGSFNELQEYHYKHTRNYQY